MKKEDLEKLYRGWDNQKLQQEFKKRHEYSDVAIEAMKSVMQQKGMAGIVEQEITWQKSREEKKAKAEKADLDALQKNYEAHMLGDNSDAKTYAAKCLENGIYMEGKIASTKFRWLRTLLISLAGIALFTAVFTAAEGELFDNALAWSSLATCLFTALIIINYRNARATYTLHRVGNRDLMEIQCGNYAFTATVPFKCMTGYLIQVYKRGMIKVEVPELYIYMTNAEGQTAVLQGYLTAREFVPPAWLPVEELDKPSKMKFFNEVTGHRVNVIKLKKILEGLNER